MGGEGVKSKGIKRNKGVGIGTLGSVRDGEKNGRWSEVCLDLAM